MKPSWVLKTRKTKAENFIKEKYQLHYDECSVDIIITFNVDCNHMEKETSGMIKYLHINSVQTVV